MPTRRALLLDLQGVLIEDGAALPGALEAVAAARREGLLLRFVTNTATRHPAAILEDLRRLGFAPHDDELITAPLAARNLLRRRGWRAHCLVHPAIRPLFAKREAATAQPAEPDCVLIGDARDELSYANLNTAFRLVRGGKFQEGDLARLPAGARLIEGIGAWRRAL